MDVIGRLLDAGFGRVIVLDGAECGIAEQRLLLAIMPYEADLPSGEGGARVHPYYPASQRAYQIASALAREAEEAGVPLRLRDDIRVKPIFARMPGAGRGRSTINDLPGLGTRFHVQIFTLDEALPLTCRLLPAPQPMRCGSCRACITHCPSGAIDDEGFHRERCLRNWQLGGKPVPEALRPLMGDRLVGCEECQRCCPANAAPTRATAPLLPLEAILADPKAACASLKDLIGANLALPNRVLAQACLIAGCSGRQDLLPLLRPLREHPSPMVREQAAWALAQLGGEA